MKNYQDDFGPFDGKIWLNCASEGPLPRVSIEAAKEAVEWKRQPFELTHKRFAQTPKDLKAAIGRLMNVPPSDVILGNSASYGIHLFANGFPLEKGDEVLVMQNDFPTDILPWLGLEKKGVVIRQIKPAHFVLSPEELTEKITKSTKLVCLSHVHTFSGQVIDIAKIGEICRNNNIIFIVNFSQSLGNTPIDLSKMPVDAMTTAGFKWLCGPYGTGFCWATPQLRERLDYNQAFWVNVMSPKQLESEDELKLSEDHSARRYDVFGTANFFNFRPLTTSIEYLLSVGIGEIQKHNLNLVERIISGLNSGKFELVSSVEPDKRSNLVVFSHKDKARNKDIFQTLVSRGIFLALWKGRLRIAPHLYNTEDEIEQLLSALNEIG